MVVPDNFHCVIKLVEQGNAVDGMNLDFIRHVTK